MIRSSAGKEVFWALVVLLVLFFEKLVPFSWKHRASEWAHIGLWPLGFTIQ